MCPIQFNLAFEIYIQIRRLTHCFLSLSKHLFTSRHELQGENDLPCCSVTTSHKFNSTLLTQIYCRFYVADNARAQLVVELPNVLASNVCKMQVLAMCWPFWFHVQLIYYFILSPVLRITEFLFVYRYYKNKCWI